MTEEDLPTTKYQIEVYENSFSNDATYHIESKTPFMNISKGDFFHSSVLGNWNNPPNLKKEKFIIKEIEHILFKIDSTKNTHKIMLLLETVEYSDN